jgi:hypothetical protein
LDKPQYALRPLQLRTKAATLKLPQMASETYDFGLPSRFAMCTCLSPAFNLSDIKKATSSAENQGNGAMVNQHRMFQITHYFMIYLIQLDGYLIMGFVILCRAWLK